MKHVWKSKSCHSPYEKEDFAVEFTSLQRNQRLQQKDVSHYGRGRFDCTVSGAPSGRTMLETHSVAVKQKKDEVSQTSQLLHKSVQATPYQTSLQHNSSRSMCPSRNSETVVWSYSTSAGLYIYSLRTPAQIIGWLLQTTLTFRMTTTHRYLSLLFQ